MVFWSIEPFQAIYRDEQLAPNLNLITQLTSLPVYAREGARTLRTHIYVSFDSKTCYSAFKRSEQYKRIINGSWQFFTGTQVPGGGPVIAYDGVKYLLVNKVFTCTVLECSL